MNIPFSKYTEALKQVSAHQCPVTCGAQVKQTLAGFKRACAVRQEEGKAPRCKHCKGMQLPDELIVIEIPSRTIKEQNMATNPQRYPGTCEHCGEKKNVRQASGKEVCSYCEVVRIHAKKRPSSLVKALEEYAPQELRIDGERADLQDSAVDKLKAEIERLRKDNAYLTGRITAIQATKEDVSEKKVVPEPNGQLNDLALRLAMAMLRSKVEGITVDDVEMLRSC